MKVPFLGPNGGEPVSRTNAGGTVTKGEPRGHAERNPSAAAHGGGPVDALTLNGRRRAPPRDRGQGTRQLGASESREQRACAARAGAKLDRGPASEVRRGGRGNAEGPACSAGRHAAASWGARLALRAGVGAIFFLASLALAQQQPILVKPGASGSLTWEVDNNGQSGGPMTNVALTVTPPSQITIQPTSKLGPVASIPAGGNYVFQIDYTIDPQATDGQISLPIHFSQDTQYATFKTTDTSVSFSRSRLQFLDEKVV